MKDFITLDAKSVREYDENGFLHVKTSPLTREQVAPYYGREIPMWREAGLEPNTVYHGYRPAEELSKPETIKSTEGIPIQLRHHIELPESPANKTRVGSTGTDAEWKPPYLMNSLHIIDKVALDSIESGALRELSLAYSYKPDFTAGVTEQGEKYDFVMRDIRANHLALVEEGRAGKNVLVLDHSLGEKMPENKIPEAGTEEHENAEVALARAILALHKKDDISLDGIINGLKEKGLTEDEAKELNEVLGPKAPEEVDAKPEEAEDEEKDEVNQSEGDNVEEVDVPDEDQEDDFDDEAEDEGDEDLDEQDESEQDEEVVEDEDTEGDLVARALEACGYSDQPEEFKRAFAAGLNFGNKESEKPAEKIPEKESEGKKEKPALAQDAAIKRSIIETLQAAEDVRSVLGKVRISAFDSAGDVYLAACKKLGVSCSTKTARSAFFAYQQGKRSGVTKSGFATDSKTVATSTVMSNLLNNVKS